jgi:transposase
MEWKLAPQERDNLKKRHRQERDGRVRDRIKAVLAYDDGYSYAEIARILLLDDETIRRHIEDYFSKRKLKPENGGSDSHLCQEAADALRSHLLEMTYLHVKDICAYVRKVFNVSYTTSGMTKWLRANGFCYKKPHGVPAKADKQKQDAFVEYYQNLKATISNDEIICFIDSTHPQHQTRLSYGWIKKGIRKAVKMTACQKRVNLIGAINLSGHTVEHRQVDWVNCESLKAFFTQLIAANPAAKKIHMILDNAGYHKSKELISFVNETNIVLHYLPPYSPNLNPIERLWKIMHENVTYNHYYQKLADFKAAILEFFTDIDKYGSVIRSRITDNFQVLDCFG